MGRSIWIQGAVAALVAVVATALMSSEAEASLALVDWNMEARRNLPLHLKAWLGAMLLANAASVFFVRKHLAARWVLGAFIVSHAWIAILEITELYTVQGGLVSLGHIIVWTPAIIALLRYRSEIALPSAYGIWACMMLLFYAVSLVFDVRDAFIWLNVRVF